MTDEKKEPIQLNQSHTLKSDRDWERALNAIHKLLLFKWYYAGIVSNTFGGMLNSADKNKYNTDRIKGDVSADFKSFFTNHIGHMRALATMIRDNEEEKGAKDVWYLSKDWADFPKGTCVIEMHQKYVGITGKGRREAYCFLDGSCKQEHQVNAMYVVNKVLTNYTYTEQVNAPTFLVDPSGKDAKKPNRKTELGHNLAIKLKKDFKLHAPHLSMTDKATLDQYFKYLETKNQLTGSLKELREKVDFYFGSVKDKDKK